MLGSILKFFLIGLLALAGVGIALGVLGAVFGVAVFLTALLLKVGVIAAVGYGAFYVFRAVTGKKPKEISAEDRKWLES